MILLLFSHNMQVQSILLPCVIIVPVITIAPNTTPLIHTHIRFMTYPKEERKYQPSLQLPF